MAATSRPNNPTANGIFISMALDGRWMLKTEDGDELYLDLDEEVMMTLNKASLIRFVCPFHVDLLIHDERAISFDWSR
uniref:Uncharacterized protein n=1 Tax=Oryza glumipatula TaxID=40148 RepID=A0A0E0ATG0_9ORYZ